MVSFVEGNVCIENIKLLKGIEIEKKKTHLANRRNPSGGVGFDSQCVTGEIFARLIFI